MNKKIKEILENVKECCNITKEQSFTVYQRQDILKLLDYITKLQEEYKEADYDRHKLFEAKDKLQNDYQEAVDKITKLQEENERLKYIGHKMHLWIFLNSGDEQKVYDELGLTDEENTMLGYSGQYRIGDKDDAINRD